MRHGVILIMCMFCCSSLLDAQDNQIFSGSGMRLGADSQDNPAGLTRAFDFSSLGKTKERRDKPLFAFPKLEMPKLERPRWMKSGNRFPTPIQFSDQDGGLFPTLPKFELFPPRDPAEPNFFQRMNSRTKEFFGRTRQGLSNWVTGTRSDVGDRTFDAWDSITQGTDSGHDTEPVQPPAQPQLRSAQRIENLGTDKY